MKNRATTEPASASTAAIAATAASAQHGSATAENPSPWWRVGMVWLVLGGPALVVVASLATAVLAYVGADEVLVHTPSARDAPVQPTGQTPAVTARNHAATAGATAATPAAAGR